ncbi:hypothetical protein P152DRAFT_482718 [Eremomyces bilateralis CBS 781.70]|uniref:Uncharacterized protein n=1 Tax=Eremomyces bilateralis CBS 781.70 TaxID=1392243 RepID=A0A6G1G0P7_9PEZI|nr:uncharacterized protein P152DRAFT_482718 [Eremomyces bilateralis CBS 781.70]KAF1811685.1 hypothetical protein P152DRAFT_482718 [Eremomyces bilateralis CBS 781.70]
MRSFNSSPAGALLSLSLSQIFSIALAQSSPPVVEPVVTPTAAPVPSSTTTSEWVDTLTAPPAFPSFPTFESQGGGGLGDFAGERGGLGGAILPIPYGEPANISTITGQGNPSIYVCYNSHLAYTSSRQSYISNKIPLKYNTTTIPYSTWVTAFQNTSVIPTTLCDGYPRFLDETVTPVTLTFSDNVMREITQTEPGPLPTCTIEETSCTWAIAAYATATYSYLSSVYSTHFAQTATGLPKQIAFNYVRPPCYTDPSCPAPSAKAHCSADSEEGTVLYWPVTTGGNFCNGSSIVPGTPTVAGAPNTAVFRGATVTSPTALVILRKATLSAASTTTRPNQGLNWQPCGHPADVTLSLAPEELSTFRTEYSVSFTDEDYTYWETSTVLAPLQFQDLNRGAVPYNEYANVRGCNINETRSDYRRCPSSILPDYTPSLVYPKQAIAQVTDASFANFSCSTGKVRKKPTFVPITAAAMEMPSATHYGAEVSVGPRTSTLKQEEVEEVMTFDEARVF